MRTASARRLVVVSATAIALVSLVRVGQPILEENQEQPVELTDLGGNQWEIRNRNYTTLLTTAEEYGGVGMEVGSTGGDTSVVSSVDTADIVLAGGSTSVGYTFASNATVTTGFNGVQAGNWTGFQAQSPGTAAGTSVDVLFTVTTMPGTTFAQLKAEVEAGSVGTSETNSGGTLIGNTFVNSTGTVTSGAGGPGMSDPWLLSLFALTIALGLFAIRRGQDQRARTGGIP